MGKIVLIILAICRLCAAEEGFKKVCAAAQGMMISAPSDWQERHRDTWADGTILVDFRKVVRTTFREEAVSREIRISMLIHHATDEDFELAVEGEIEGPGVGSRIKYVFESNPQFGGKAGRLVQVLYPEITFDTPVPETKLVLFAKCNLSQVIVRVTIADRNGLIRSRVINAMSKELAPVIASMKDESCE